MGNGSGTGVSEIDYNAFAFPKASWKTSKKLKEQQSNKKRSRKRKKHRKSIMHPKGSGYCYLCATLHNDYTYKPTQEHHVVFGSGQRELSEKYGLTVQLCMEHHKEGPEAAHNNQAIRELLCRDAQEVFAMEYPNLNWIQIFKKNYSEVEDEETKETDIASKESVESK